jgi:diguanylate cyclase (GGDEF)-like protein
MKSTSIVHGLLTLGAAACAGGAAAFVASRLANKQVVESQDHVELMAATSTLRKKNEQLESLYTVFSEITESLEIRYGINSTLRETIKLMRADMAVLRKVSGDELITIGAMASTGQEIQHIRPVGVGDGPTGRAFKRGRTVRIDENGEGMMAPPDMAARALSERPDSPASQTGRAPLESGLIVPLIIGAKAVGTLSCWSQRTFAFDTDDEHILEMLASQVATAMVAADTMANSEKRAVTDPLTDLPNRLQFNDDLHGPLLELSHSGRRALIAMADIDHFKRFNDEYGHSIGDVALQKVAGVLKAAVREGDHVYRYGGEEFVFIFCDAGHEQAIMLAERVRSAMEAAPFQDERGLPIGPITISIGIAEMPVHGKDIAALIELADVAMYKAKSTGRNRVVIWDESMVTGEAAA